MPPPYTPPPETAQSETTPGPTSIIFGLKGRAPRLYYWAASVSLLVTSRIIVYISNAEKAQLSSASPNLAAGLAVMVFLLLLLAVVSYANFTVVVRRWHDRGKSGYWAILGFIPIIGWIWQGIECGFLEGTLGPNRFGPSPKGIAGVSYEDEASVFT